LKITSAALKSVDSELKVGGPATCQSQYLNETIQYCLKNNVALDFISTHEYPTDPGIKDRHIMKKSPIQSKKRSWRSSFILY